MTLRRKHRWKLSTISNITLLGLFLVGSIFLVALVNYNTKQQALRNAELYASMILDRNVATHAFFNNALKTSLYDLFEEHFFEPNWMSTTFAINSLAEDYGLFTQESLYYKEFSINARNPKNEADPLEREFLEKLKQDKNLSITTAIRDYDGEPFFTIMRRGQSVKDECLLCHGDPADAPTGIVSHYGSERGFHRSTGEVASGISIRIPMAMAYQDANSFSLKLSGVLLGLLLFIFAFQYVMTRKLLFNPINSLHSQAKGIAFDRDRLGEELPIPVGRELAEMVEAFNAMSTELQRHQQSLEETIEARTKELQAANTALNKDIEIRKQVERSLEQLSHRNEMIINTTSEGILGLDAEGTITFFNQAAAKMMGLQDDHKKSINILNYLKGLKTEPMQPNPVEEVKKTLVNGEVINENEALLAHMEKHLFPIEYSCAPLKNKEITGAVFSFKNIAERKRSEREIQNLAFYDQLTKLPNRTLFYDRIKQRVAQAERDQEELAVMFFDLDDFKVVNDTLGHDAGDEFLKVIARRLMEGSRQADTIARLGGDEFVWFGEIIDKDDAELIAKKFLQGVAQPVNIGGQNFISTVSIGISLFPDSATDVVGLMKCADTAMYSAKQQSKNAFHFYRKLRGS